MICGRSPPPAPEHVRDGLAERERHLGGHRVHVGAPAHAVGAEQRAPCSSACSPLRCASRSSSLDLRRATFDAAALSSSQTWLGRARAGPRARATRGRPGRRASRSSPRAVEAPRAGRPVTQTQGGSTSTQRHAVALRGLARRDRRARAPTCARARANLSSRLAGERLTIRAPRGQLLSIRARVDLETGLAALRARDLDAVLEARRARRRAAPRACRARGCSPRRALWSTSTRSSEMPSKHDRDVEAALDRRTCRAPRPRAPTRSATRAAAYRGRAAARRT